ncbi:MAG: PVC-type heme-binding CxxCH protein [Pirellulaceae bacterium]
MRPFICSRLWAAWALVPAVLASLTAVDAADTPAADDIPFEVPAGFEVERVAGPPLVERPMMAGFDDRGRLFVCDSSGFNLLKGSSEILVQNPPHAIRMLEDADGDGRFDKSTVFADKMTFPMGALWYDGVLYTASAPSIWKLADTDGDGVADERQEFVSRIEFGGNACDVHGPFLGPDGRLYWANCQRGFEIRQPNGQVLRGKAAGLFRIRPDGTDAEIVCAGGMDNPVEAVFTPEGEAFATVNLFHGGNQPRTDAIIHCIDGGLFPYRELSADFKHTGERLPAMIDLGWVAPAGLLRMRGASWGAEFTGNLFSAHFNRHRIQRHVIQREGATFRGTLEDFVTSNDIDFHPTDVVEAPDGSLLLIDTGGWFLRGCPTSQIAKPERTGAIYRIRRQNAPPVTDPWGLALEWKTADPRQLVGRLADARWAVRDRAIHELHRRGEPAVAMLRETLKKADDVEARRNAVWALTRIGTAEGLKAVTEGLTDADPSVRLAAGHAVGLHRWSGAVSALRSLAITDVSTAVRRQAATALGRIRHPAGVPALTEALCRPGSDRFLEHAQIYALLEIADRDATLLALGDPEPAVQRAALIALDQMADGGLTRAQVEPLLASPDAALQQAALAVVNSRPDWGDAVVGLLQKWLREPELTESQRQLVKAAILNLGAQPQLQEVVASVLTAPTTSASVRRFVMEAIGQSPLAALPESWLAALRNCLKQHDEGTVLTAIAAVRSLGVEVCDAELRQLAGDSRRSAEIRTAASVAAAPRLDELSFSQFTFLQSQLTDAMPPLTRLAAAQALGRAPLNPAQLQELLGSIESVGAMELPSLLAAFERSSDGKLGNQLVQAVRNSPGRAGLPADFVRAVVARYPEEVRRSAAELVRELQLNIEQQQARLAEMEPVLAGGNPFQGRGVFFGTKGACISCHTVGGTGGKVGPDLTKIGSIRSPRDLLESVLFPSASFVRSYEPYVVETTDGIVLTGVLGRDAADAVHLVGADRVEQRIARSRIGRIEPGRVSIMPQGLDAQLTHQELRDLLAYLGSLK